MRDIGSRKVWRRWKEWVRRDECFPQTSGNHHECNPGPPNFLKATREHRVPNLIVSAHTHTHTHTHTDLDSRRRQFTLLSAICLCWYITMHSSTARTPRAHILVYISLYIKAICRSDL